MDSKGRIETHDGGGGGVGGSIIYKNWDLRAEKRTKNQRRADGGRGKMTVFVCQQTDVAATAVLNLEFEQLEKVEEKQKCHGNPLVPDKESLCETWSSWLWRKM